MKKVMVVVLILFCLLSILGQWNWIMKPFEEWTCFEKPPRDPEPKQTNVFFLKTHKTASSTMQNILFRFAERHNLTVALPGSGHQFGYPGFFKSDSVDPITIPANIITNHMRFKKKELQKLMPLDTVYITIMRESSAMFESLFVYYSSHSQSFHRVPNKSIQTFLERPFQYYHADETDSMYARNCLTFDLGGDKDAYETDYAARFAAEIEETFSLVLIADHFDESLIVLRHLLNWDLEDILYFKVNMRSEKAKKTVTPELSAKMRAWNAIDSHLFDHFNASLWRQLELIGLECVAKEVELLREAQKEVTKICFGEETARRHTASEILNRDFKPWQPRDVDIVGYELHPDLSAENRSICTKLIMPELQYTEVMRKLQHERYKKAQEVPRDIHQVYA